MNIVKTAALLLILAFAHPIAVRAQHPNIRVSSLTATNPEEVTIAINPANPAVMAAGANINWSYRSTDSGATWSSMHLTSSYGVYGDPCVIFDSKGNLFYTHLSNPPIGTGHWLDRIVVQKSIDGGLTWDAGTGIGLNPPKQQDKSWLGVDLTASPYHDNVYVAWTEFDKYGSTNPVDSSRILFARTTDGGATWSAPVRVSDQAGNCTDSDSTVEGAVPAIGPDGTVYLSWAGPLGIVCDRSTDGGLTWGADRFVDSMPGGWDFNISGISRANGLPVTACDASNSPYRGTVYVAWSDQRNDTTNTDVFLARSADQGLTWSAPLRVNDDALRRQQFFHWMTVDPKTGAIWFVFYDRRATTGDSTEVWGALSTDGGRSFKNFRISDIPFLPVSNVFFGDYICIAALNGVAFPIWTRMDGTALSVWTTRLSESIATGVAELRETPMQFVLMQNYPNPFNPATIINYTVGQRQDYGTIPKGPLFGVGLGEGGRNVSVQLVVYDILGREVATLVNEHQRPGSYRVFFDGAGLASGVYLYRLTAGSFRETRRMMLVR